MYHFVCTNCKKSFQSEESVPKECPFCFWGSSIRKVDANGLEIPIQSEKKTDEKTTAGTWVTMGLVVFVCLVVSLGMHYNSVAKASTSTNSSNSELAIVLGLLGLLWTGINAIWPFLLAGFLIFVVQWIIKDSVKEGIEEAMANYSVKDELKEIIREAIEEARTGPPRKREEE